MLTRSPLQLISMELSIVSSIIPPLPMRALPAVQLRVRTIVQGGPRLVGADVDAAVVHVPVAARLHQVDLA